MGTFLFSLFMMKRENGNVPTSSFQEVAEDTFYGRIFGRMDRPEIEEDRILVDSGEDGRRAEAEPPGQFLGREGGGADGENLGRQDLGRHGAAPDL
jgi:hypothetical protein